LKLPDDDELYEVDSTYLGPPRRYVAVMRHRAIFSWLVIGPVTFVVLHRLGLPFNPLTLGLMVLGTIYAAQVIADKATHEKPVGSLFSAFWNDLRSPRGRRRPHGAATPPRHRTHLGRKPR
jgi:hypothetical protein